MGHGPPPLPVLPRVGGSGPTPRRARHERRVRPPWEIVRQWSDDVIYFAHTQQPSELEAAELAARGIRVVEGDVARLVVENDQLTGVELADGDVIRGTAVFIRP